MASTQRIDAREHCELLKSQGKRRSEWPQTFVVPLEAERKRAGGRGGGEEGERVKTRERGREEKGEEKKDESKEKKRRKRDTNAVQRK